MVSSSSPNSPLAIAPSSTWTQVLGTPINQSSRNKKRRIVGEYGASGPAVFLCAAPKSERWCSDANLQNAMRDFSSPHIKICQRDDALLIPPLWASRFQSSQSMCDKSRPEHVRSQKVRVSDLPHPIAPSSTSHEPSGEISVSTCQPRSGEIDDAAT